MQSCCIVRAHHTFASLPPRRGKTIKALKKRAAAETAVQNVAVAATAATAAAGASQSAAGYKGFKRGIEGGGGGGGGGGSGGGDRKKRARVEAPKFTIKEALRLQKEKAEGTAAVTSSDRGGGIGRSGSGGGAASLAGDETRVAGETEPVRADEQANYVGLDCEMVGTGASGKRSVLARACVVDWHGRILYDAFVQVRPRAVLARVLIGARATKGTGPGRGGWKPRSFVVLLFSVQKRSTPIEAHRRHITEHCFEVAGCNVHFKKCFALFQVGERVTDFRTEFSGVRPRDLKSKAAVTFTEAAAAVAGHLKGKVLVGHALKNDLNVLLLSHPRNMTRDTARWRPYQRYGRDGKFKPKKLKDLAREHLGLVIQGGEHTPDEDAKAAMLLYRHKRREWEGSLRTRAKAAGGSGGKAPKRN